MIEWTDDAIVLSAGDAQPSFVLATARLDVVRVKGGAYVMTRAKQGDAIVLGPAPDTGAE